ncbi:prepilin-type N-terminal cleavage/methylation domain-containing protein [bacterium]|nr:prepilin-type N-terminal cleavage/methylation domain-containing protein [bacterium]
MRRRDERARDPRAKLRTGFTMIELLVVLGIIGLVLFVVIPNIDGMSPRYRLRSAARRIASTVELAQGQAIAQGKEVAIEYDLEHRTYWVILATSDPPADTKAKDPNAPPPPPIDAEHGPAPVIPEGSTPTPSSSTSGTSKPALPPPPPPPVSYEGRETLTPETLPDDIVIDSVSLPSGKEATSGTIIVPFSPTGEEGSHSVLVRLRNQNGIATSDPPIAVRFNALTRTIDFGNEKLGWTQLAPQ